MASAAAGEEVAAGVPVLFAGFLPLDARRHHQTKVRFVDDVFASKVCPGFFKAGSHWGASLAGACRGDKRESCSAAWQVAPLVDRGKNLGQFIHRILSLGPIRSVETMIYPGALLP